MWLIDVNTHALWAFDGADVPPYAILSHTWGQDEVSFDEFKVLATAKLKHGFRKIRWTCDQSKEDGLGWAWVDTCCIDKRSSAELQEAINSMFMWYQGSARCYAYLADVHPPFLTPLSETEIVVSRWFKRGWKLQELLAPEHVIFFNSKWAMVGNRSSLCRPISRQTGIPVNLLRGEALQSRGPESFDLAGELK